MGRPRGSQTLRIRDVVRTCRRMDELTAAGRTPYRAAVIVGKETNASRGSVEYRYRQGREIVAGLEAAAAGWASVRRTVELLRRGGPLAGLRRTLSFLSVRRR